MFRKICIAIALACLVALSAASVAVLLEARGLLRDARSDSAQIQGKIVKLLDTAQDASEQARQFTAEQRSNLQAELKEIRKTTADAHDLLIHTDLNLNGTHNHPESGVLPRLAALLGDSDGLVRESAVELRKTMDALQPSLENFARASAAAAERMADPKIAASVAHLDEATSNLAAVSQSAAGIAANGKTASDLALERFRRMLKPVPFARALLEKLFGLAGTGAQIYGATR